jgi:hypothetical protein
VEGLILEASKKAALHVFEWLNGVTATLGAWTLVWQLSHQRACLEGWSREGRLCAADLVQCWTLRVPHPYLYLQCEAWLCGVTESSDQEERQSWPVGGCARGWI